MFDITPSTGKTVEDALVLVLIYNVMFYNGIFMEASYEYNPKAATSLFEKLAYEYIKHVQPISEEIIVHCYHSETEFEYSMKAYAAGIKLPVAEYCVSQTTRGWREEITLPDDDFMLYERWGTEKWDTKFFGIDRWMSADKIIKILKKLG